jgi:hypothetical protein
MNEGNVPPSRREPRNRPATDVEPPRNPEEIEGELPNPSERMPEKETGEGSERPSPARRSRRSGGDSGGGGEFAAQA